MKKRILSVALALCMALTLLPTAALAADDTAVGIEVGTETAFKDAWDANTGTVTLRLANDILLTDTLTARQSCTYIVEGNGHVLKNVALSGSGSVELNADIQNFGYAKNGITSALTVSGQGDVTVNGDVTSTGGNSIDMQASAHVTVNGDVAGGVSGNTLLPAGSGATIRLLPQDSATGALTVSGTITGGSNAGTGRYGSALRYVNLSEAALSWGDYPAEGVYSIDFCRTYGNSAMNFIVDVYVKAAENAVKQSSADFAVLKDAMCRTWEQFGVSTDPINHGNKAEDIAKWSKSEWEHFLTVDLADAVRQTISNIQSDNPSSFEQTAAFTENMESTLLTALENTSNAAVAIETFQQDVVDMRANLLSVDGADAVRAMISDVAPKDTADFPYLRALCLAFANLVQMPEEERPTESEISAEIEKDTTDGTSFANWYVDEIIRYTENNTDKITPSCPLRLSNLSERAFADSLTALFDTTNRILQDWQKEQTQGVALVGPAVTLENITVTEGQTLTATTGGELTNQGTVTVSGTLTLPSGTTAAQIKTMNLTGSGLVKVGDKAYTTDVEPLHVYTTAMDFSKDAAEGNWIATATLDNDGYTWDGTTKTLTLNKIYLTASADSNALTLPADAKLILSDGSLNWVTNTKGMGICIPDGALTIGGSGSLDVQSWLAAIDQQGLTIESGVIHAKSNNVIGIFCKGPLAISGGSVTAEGTVYGIYSSPNMDIRISGGIITAAGTGLKANGINSSGNLILSGGTVHATGTRTALWAAKDLTLSGMRITKPADAVLGDSVNDPGGKAILLSGADALDVTVEKKPAHSGGGSASTEFAVTAGNKGAFDGKNGLTFRSKGAYSRFVSAAVGGKKLDASSYTVETGSTILTLKPEYLSALPAGKYELVMTFTGGYSKATFTIGEKTENPFTDVMEADYYYKSALWAVKNGVTSGATSTTFSPDAVCTRAQAVTFLWRAMGSPEPTSTQNPFMDVKSDVYYYKAVLWAVEEGVTSGTSDTTFSPDATVTRAQTVTFQWRAAGKPMVNYAMNFTDVQADSYYGEAARWAVSEQLTEGTAVNAFSPNNSCTRAQIITFLFRQLGK